MQETVGIASRFFVAPMLNQRPVSSVIMKVGKSFNKINTLFTMNWEILA